MSDIPVNVLEGNAINPICTMKNNIKCQKSRYRTINGTCNNLRNPTWGVTTNTYRRILPSKYGDGMYHFSY